MDPKTLEIYDLQAEELSSNHKLVIPQDLYDLTEKYFLKSAKSADLGCGIGRDTNWLMSQGYPVIGYDGSKGMLAQAEKAYPKLRFIYSLLPDLKEIETNQFENIFCSAVLMHLPESELETAIKNIIRITKESGTILCSIRASKSGNSRENGRLFEPFTLKTLEELFKKHGASLLHQEELLNEKQEKIWKTIVVRKNK